MIVVATPRIELCPTDRAAIVTLHVLENSHCCSARAAKYRWLVPLTFRPDCYRMISKHQMAAFAGIVKAATFHFDRDDISRSVIMLATSLWIEIYAVHARRSRSHGFH